MLDNNRLAEVEFRTATSQTDGFSLCKLHLDIPVSCIYIFITLDLALQLKHHSFPWNYLLKPGFHMIIRIASWRLVNVQRNTRLVKNITVRRSAYLTLVRSLVGYATQIWTPQSIDLIRKLERVHRRATKYILDLPFICDQTYRDRLIKLVLLPISYWHEFLDMTFFLKL